MPESVLRTHIRTPTQQPSPLHAGLCSVTLRALAPEVIVPLAERAGLSCIEWGGDVHVPHGDLARAREVARLTREQGLSVCSYGSYWRADGDSSGPALSAVLDTAVELGTQVVRVWAGRVDGRHASGEERRVTAGHLRAAAEAAHLRGLRLACEFHDNTLTSTPASARRLLAEEVGHPALRCHWQPAHGQGDAVCLASLRELAPWIEYLHVFHWWPTLAERLSLADGFARWSSFIAAMPQDGRARAALLEFLPGDDAALLGREAGILVRLLANHSAGSTVPIVASP